MLFTTILAIHNILRWLALALVSVAAMRALLGWLGKREWTPADRKLGMFSSMSLDIQILLGLVLYIFLSPLTKAAFQNFGTAMSSPELRFFALEHSLYMVLAVVFAHLGAVLPRKATEPVSKHKRAALAFALALLLILVGMPWSRPLLPV